MCAPRVPAPWSVSGEEGDVPACVWGWQPAGPRLAEAEMSNSRMHIPFFLRNQVPKPPPSRLVLSSYF